MTIREPMRALPKSEEEEFVKSFVIKGHICYNRSKTELAVLENAYAVCEDGMSRGVFRELPAEYARLPLVDHGDTDVS